MGELNKVFAGHEDFLILIAVIVSIIMFFIVIYIISKIRYPENERSSNIGIGNRLGRNNTWNGYYDQNREWKPSGREKESKNQTVNSNQFHNKLSVKQDNSNESLNQSNTGYEDYIKKEKEKGIYVQETKNDDGTVRSVIDFDLSNNELAPVSIPHKYEYLEAANGGQFRKLLPSDEKSFFRTWVEDGVRKFEFHGNVDKALANINAIFDDVCEIEGKQNGATQIENIDPGELTNQLKVKTPAKIKLI